MSVFVDTSAWVALASTRDGCHRRAVGYSVRRVPAARIVTSESVLGETVTVLQARYGHGAAVAFLDSLQAPAGAPEIVYVDEELRSESLAIFRKAGDQAFSYVDCLSFAIMRRMRIQDAFTFDTDFARFGFTVVPGDVKPGRRAP